MNNQTLWSGRFEKNVDKSTLKFTSSLDVDKKLLFYDVMGSLAHVRMLKKCKIIHEEDADKIIEGLKKIDADIKSGKFVLNESLEDIHTNVEFALTELIGPVGGKLHTGRSRNDQVATDFKMYLRDSVLEIISLINVLIDTLIAIAKNNTCAIMPGFTHMQHAQPVTVAQHMLAYVFKFGRDALRFFDAFKRMNECPLGVAALAGTVYPIDRNMTAKSLGFEKPTSNSMDSVSDRDFVAELAFCAAMVANHMSNMAEELVLWSSQEFGFIEMNDKYTTGSSIMPQKKNPDIAELIRGKTGSVTGNLVSLLMMTKGLPLSYNRDLQEDKAPMMASLDTVSGCLKMIRPIISTMKFNTETMRTGSSSGFINATDLADYLVTHGLPFRYAHEIVGKLVRYCIENNKKLEDLSIKEFSKFSPQIGEDVYSAISIEKCVEKRKSYGGTSSQSVDMQISQATTDCNERKRFVTTESNKIKKCWQDLVQ
ncbi:MAG: argininosuccinate lyase [archaeon]|nr:argininosuccinate lyase [archaeon]